MDEKAGSLTKTPAKGYATAIRDLIYNTRYAEHERVFECSFTRAAPACTRQ